MHCWTNEAVLLQHPTAGPSERLAELLGSYSITGRHSDWLITTDWTCGNDDD